MGAASRVCSSCDTPVPADAAFCPTCGAPTPTDLNTAFGEGFEDRLAAALRDRYRIQREVGRGGMAVVYLAQDLRHERQVAVKVLRPELAASVGAERFLREIKLAAKLTHQNVLALYDSGDADGFLYYVMPYVEGESLRQKLNRERQLPIDEALRLTREIAEGLDYAHEQGIIHRDIKPENILLSRGHALIADFGIARAVAKPGASNLTSTGTSVGTPLYMSPEQAAGDPHLDHRSDIYSLGCMLYEMLAGEPPFTGPNVQAIMAKHAIEQRPSVRTVRDTVPEAVDQAIRQAMAKVPPDRFSGATSFAAAISAGGSTPLSQANSSGSEAAERHRPQDSRIHVPAMDDVVAYDPNVREILNIARKPFVARAVPVRKRRVSPWLVGSAAAAIALTVGVVGMRHVVSSSGNRVDRPRIDASPRLMVGAEYFSLNRLPDAVATFQAVGADEAVRLEDRRVAFALLARTFLESGKPDSARAAVAALLDLEPPLVVLFPRDFNDPLAQLYYDVRRERIGYLGDSPEVGRDSVVIAILPFAIFYQGNDESDELSAGVAALLQMQLGGTGGDTFRIVERWADVNGVEPLPPMIPEPLQDAVGASHDDWRVLDESRLPPRWTRVTHYVFGSLVRAPKRAVDNKYPYVLSAWMYNSAGRLSAVAQTSGIIDSLDQGVADLGSQLITRINELSAHR